MPSYAAPKPPRRKPYKPNPRPLNLNWIVRSEHAASLLNQLAAQHPEGTQTGDHVRRALAHIALARNLKTNKAYLKAMQQVHFELGRAFMCTEPKDG